MGYWIKRFADGTELRGDDQSVARRAISWRNSRSTPMVGAEAAQNGHRLVLYGSGEYWQSDTYIANIGESVRPMICQRRIEKLIKPADVYFNLTDQPNKLEINFFAPEFGSNIVAVTKEYQGHWLILEYDIPSNTHRYYFKENRI